MTPQQQTIIANAFALPSMAHDLQDEIREAMMGSMYVPPDRLPRHKAVETVLSSGMTKVQIRVLSRFYLPKRDRFVPLTFGELYRKEGGKRPTIQFHVENLLAKKAMIKSYVKTESGDEVILELTQIGKDAVLMGVKDYDR